MENTLKATFAISRENYPNKGTEGIAAPDKFSASGKGWVFRPFNDGDSVYLVDREWLMIESAW